MKELDFDELDKAVNSLMSNVPGNTQSPATDPPTRTVELPDTGTIQTSQTPSLSAAPDTKQISDSSTDAVTAPVPSVSPIAPVTSEEKPAQETSAAAVTPRPAPTMPAARRGGRFMDVVHPSSDMKTSSATTRISREGAQLSPVSQNVSATTAERPVGTVATPEVEPVIAPKTDNVQPVAEAQKVASSESSSWPDPIDTPAFSPSAKNEDTDAPEPLASPFISGTKVEKRPLGGLQPDKDAVATQDVEPETQPTTDESAQLPPSLPDAASELPDELNSDVLAVESTNHQEEPAQKVVADTPPSTISEPVSSASAAVGASSIPQQYAESPSTGDQTNGAVFDTNTYHKPIEHPAKNKSGWLLVVWIVLILLIGAAGGAAIYMLKIF